MRLIDSDALIEFASNHVGGMVDCNDIARFPTVDAVEVVHGKWVKKTADCVYYYACSECEEPVLKSRWGHDCFTRYCPNCGAKMDGDENG